jgi:glycosyltransferase involved in cell wall biosynthesis
MSARTSSRTSQPDQVDVLALIDHFVLGGAETLLSRFALAAPSAGIRLTVVCLAELDGNPAAAPLEEAGNAPINLELEGRPGFHALRTVRAQIASVRPQIVHTHLGTSDLLGSLAARSLGVPAISTIHTTLWHRRREVLGRKLVRACVTRVIAVSESARDEYLARGLGRAHQVVTIHNGIDVTAAAGEGAAVRRELGIAPDDLVVAMVSALRPEKAHDVAIAAVRILRPRFPNLRLLIVGQGDLRDQISRDARDLGQTVVLAGLRPDVMRVLDAADLCLHPSRRDAFPSTIIEAMAARVPVIATATGGIPEILTSRELGTLIPAPPEPGPLSDALEDLLSRPERRYAIAAAARACYERRFTAGPWVRRTRALYDEVIAER